RLLGIEGPWFREAPSVADSGPASASLYLPLRAALGAVLADRRRLDRRAAVLFVDGEAHALAVVLRQQVGAVLLQLGGELLEREAVGGLAELDLQLAEAIVGLPPVQLVGIRLLGAWHGEVLHGDVGLGRRFRRGLLVALAKLVDQRRAHPLDERRLVAGKRLGARLRRRQRIEDLAHRGRRLAGVGRQTVGHLACRKLPVVRRDLVLGGPLPLRRLRGGLAGRFGGRSSLALWRRPRPGLRRGLVESLGRGLRRGLRLRSGRRRTRRFHHLVLSRRPVARGPGDVARACRLAARLTDVRPDQRRRARGAPRRADHAILRLHRRRRDHVLHHGRRRAREQSPDEAE